MQFPLPFPPQFVPQFPLQLPFTWHELFSPAKGQEMPDEFKTRAIPARSRTSATIGYLFIICPLIFVFIPYPTKQIDSAFSIYISL